MSNYSLVEKYVNNKWYYSCIELGVEDVGQQFQMLREDIIFFLETIAQQSKSFVQYNGLDGHFCWDNGQLITSKAY